MLLHFEILLLLSERNLNYFIKRIQYLTNECNIIKIGALTSNAIDIKKVHYSIM